MEGAVMDALQYNTRNEMLCVEWEEATMNGK